MVWITIAMCLFIAVIGAIGVGSPTRLFSILRQIQTPAGLFFASAFRLTLGLLLLILAEGSKMPAFVGIFGAVAVVAGVSTPIIGLKRIGRMMEWWTAQPAAVLRLWAAVALALGLVLLWALLP